VTATVGVLALQGDVREHLAVLRACGVEAVSVRRPSELDAVDGLVLPGGESTTMIKLIESFELLDPLRKRIADGMPTYGSCAGMILLADRIADGRVDQKTGYGQQTLGGLDITVRRNAFGRQVDSFEADVSVTGIAGGPIHAVFIRAPWVDEIGPAAQALGRVRAAEQTRQLASAEVNRAAGRIVAVRQQQLLATSFHPELTGDGRVHAYFVEMVRNGH
jgi:5'-phosphate synthase pdxT subunit